MRRSWNRPATMVAVLVTVAACAARLDTAVDPLDREVTAAAAEVNLDAALMGSARTLEDARAELARHRDGMDEVLDQLRQRLAERCDPRARAASTMAELLAQLEARIAAYADEIAAAGSMPAVADAAERYGEDMDVLLARILERWNGIDCR